MTLTAMDRVGQYVRDYNDARNAGDLENAVRYGRLAVRDATDELKKNNLPEIQKEYYQKVVRSINEYLANPVALSKKATASQSASEDKIKATDWFSAPVPDLKMKDVAGLKDARDEVAVNVFAPLNPRLAPIYRKYRGESQGIQLLLYGPPGGGKTFFVRALAGELSARIAVVRVADALAGIVGDGAKIISEIFEQASRFDKCIIFFDEIDAIASTRDDPNESRYTKEQLTALLTCMDGFTAKTKPGQIRIVIAATNRPYALDPAIRRGGRFDTQIYVPLPDEEARRYLVDVALGRDVKAKERVEIPCDSDVTTQWLVERTDGYAGADIKAICRQASNRAMKRELLAATKGETVSDCVTRRDFEYVFERYINSVTDESLMQFDAYRMNMQYGMEFFRVKCDQIIRALYNGTKLEKYEDSWFKKMYARGYVDEEFGKQYDLSFLKEKLQ